MKLRPILTEKSMKDAESGKYSFWVPVAFTKHQIKKLISETFGVNVTKVRTQNRASGVKTTLARRKTKVKARKKAVVVLKGKEKLDLFEGEKKGAKK